MPQIVRLLLTIAFVIFLAGVIWSFWAVSHRRETVTVVPGVKETITTSTSTPPVVVTAPTPAPSTGFVSAPVAKPVKKARSPQTVYYTYYYEDTGSSASAWARSGVNPDGSTYAEAHAQ